MYYFDKSDYLNFKDGNSKNFAIGNGLGGITSMSIINSNYRKQFGYLVCSLNPPVSRFLVLNKTNEKVIINKVEYDLETTEYKDNIKEGQKYLEEFSMNHVPTFLYNVSGVSIKKRLAPVYGFNAVAITYEIVSKVDSSIVIEPLFNYREQGDVSEREDLLFEESYKNNIYTLTPNKNPNVHIKMSFEGVSLYNNENKYTEPFYYDYDFTNGDSRYDYQYKPVYLKTDIKANQIKYISIVVTIDRVLKKDAFALIIEEEERINKVLRQAKLTDRFASNLAWSADNFIVKRESTNKKTILAGLPWFADWGRDTMIAFCGLTLVTRRFKEAKEILESFKQYEVNGLIPNMFPTLGEAPLYNTADASLWYIYACYQYVKYTNDYDFIKNNLYNTLVNIIDNYKKGTLNSIYMDSDYLIHAGSDLDQVTWMDVRFENYCVTPRHGKPVEINALWYNALCIMNLFSNKFNYNNEDYKLLADKVYQSFRNKYYNQKLNCLYDVIDPYDDKIRPNQLYAFSLDFKVFSQEEALQMYPVISRLYNINGIRSLDKNDKDYKPKYEGPLRDRDLAYHMGTTWGYLLGPYFDYYHYVYPNNKQELIKMYQLLNSHLEEGCINGFAEVFNGDEAIVTKGCYNQAWSIGEVLRSYYENVLKEENKNE